MVDQPGNDYGQLPVCRGRLTAGKVLADVTWLRVGGPAQWLFQPKDTEDLAEFLKKLDPAIPTFVLGAGSNLIVRDGGIPGVVIRLGSGFGHISTKGQTIIAGASALDSRVAVKAAEQGLDLVFLRTIPGTIGGAVSMNAGCYGRYVEHVCREATVVGRDGRVSRIDGTDLGFRYRGSGLPRGSVVVEASFECPGGDPEALAARMAEQVDYRNRTQPTRIRTAGSAFRNPSGWSSTGSEDIDHSMKAWKLIDQAGLRGTCNGRACVSTLHPNFLINTGGATAEEIEDLGESVRSKVLATSGILLEWEVLRVGDNLRTTEVLPT